MIPSPRKATRIESFPSFPPLETLIRNDHESNGQEKHKLAYTYCHELSTQHNRERDGKSTSLSVRSAFCGIKSLAADPYAVGMKKMSNRGERLRVPGANQIAPFVVEFARSS